MAILFRSYGYNETFIRYGYRKAELYHKILHLDETLDGEIAALHQSLYREAGGVSCPENHEVYILDDLAFMFSDGFLYIGSASDVRVF